MLNGDICDKCVHEEHCAMAKFGGHNPKITACCKYAERQKMDERSERRMSENCVVCTDGRFELIAAYKQKLIEGTNIETRPEEMAVIDSILLRFWQMGWLDEKEIEE